MFPYRRVCTMQSLAAGFWGLVLLALPAQVLAVLGATTDDTGLVLGRFAGAMLAALGVSLYVQRSQQDVDVRRRLAVANAVCDLAVAGVLAQAYAAGLTSGFVGGMVVFFFCMAATSWLGTTRDTSVSPEAGRQAT